MTITILSLHISENQRCWRESNSREKCVDSFLDYFRPKKVQKRRFGLDQVCLKILQSFPWTILVWNAWFFSGTSVEGFRLQVFKCRGIKSFFSFQHTRPTDSRSIEQFRFCRLPPSQSNPSGHTLVLIRKHSVEHSDHSLHWCIAVSICFLLGLSTWSELNDRVSSWDSQPS